MAAIEREPLQVKCANPDCRVATDGRCIEGFPDTAECPQFGKTPTDVSAPKSDADSPSVPGVVLPPSITLPVIDAAKILADRFTHVVAIVGPHDAGKTSLIAGLYDLFQGGLVLDIAFARSETLHSFEQACHDSRAASRRETPHMERTEHGEVRFYHLDLVNTFEKESITVLFADRAGEEYFETRNDPDTAKDFPELGRADTITLLADGAKLLDPGLRHNVKSEVRQTLQAALDAGVIRPWQRLAVVLTKLDQVRESERRDKAFEDFNGLIRSLQETFGGHFAKIDSFLIAASPKSSAAQRGEGLADLLKFWLLPALRHEPTEISRASVVSTRYFGRLQRAADEA